MEKSRILNICFTSHSYNSYSETFIHNLKAGINGEVFHCFGDLYPFMSDRRGFRSYKDRNLMDRLFYKIGLIRRPLHEHYFIEFLKKNKIDLIFTNYGSSGALLYPIAVRLQIPFIIHFHGYDASVKSVLVKYKDSYKKMFEVAQFLIVVSEEMRNDLIQMGACKEKVIKITYAPHPRFLKLKPKYSSNQILAIGRFVEKKAPYLTLLAYNIAKKQCPSLTLKMVGDGVLLSICQDLCNSLNIPDVEFVGVQTPEEVAFHLVESFCFVQHSKQASNGDKEGTPVAILEAMASGLPIVATRHAGISDVVLNEVNGFLVEEGNIESMAGKIIDLFKNRILVEKFGLKSKEIINNEYSSNEYFVSVNSLIEKAIGHV